MRVAKATILPLALAVLAATALFPAPVRQSAWALSEIKREELPPPADSAQQTTDPAAPQADPDIADPDATLPPQNDGQMDNDGSNPADTPADGEPAPTDEAGPIPLPEPPNKLPGDDADAPGLPARPDFSAGEPAPEVMRDLSLLPEPVRRMRQLILDACATGDIEKLRPLLGKGDDGTILALGGNDGDPVELLKSNSGDAEGQEILAILEEVLEAGFVHLDAGKPTELYVWPYFFALPLDKLTPPQKVELYRLITAGDYEDMQSLGSYIFFRAGITPEGRWSFFVAGE